MITFYYVFSTSYDEAWTNCKSCDSNLESPYNDICPFFMKTCVLRVPNMINYIFSMHLQLSNGKLLFVQHKTRHFKQCLCIMLL
jgi:hypothetical protein